MTDAYEVFLSSSARRETRDLEHTVAARVIAAIDGLRQNPPPHGCRKIVGEQNAWRIRVGDHRIIYEVDDSVKMVRVLAVRHRREAYR